MKACIGALFLLLAWPASAQTPATVLSVTDGDSFRAEVNPWPQVYIRTAVRLLGVDTPELSKPRCPLELEKALQARAELTKLLKAPPVLLYDVKPDKYAGRVDARVTAGGQDVAATMIALGLARAYDGGARRGWCP